MRFHQGRGIGSVPFSAEWPNEAMSIRVRNCLCRLGFVTVGDLAQYLVKYNGSLPVTRNTGQKAFDEIQQLLSGLHDSPGPIPFYPNGPFGPHPKGEPGIISAAALSVEEKATRWDEVVRLVDRLRSEVSP